MAPSRRSLSVFTISGAGVASGLALLALTGASAVPAAAPAALSLAPNNGPAARLRTAHARPITATPGWASTNWSGYAITTSSKFTSVTGAWSVPSVARTFSATYSAAWVGIDGFANSSLIQTGTEQDYYNGAAHYAVWWTTSAQGFAEQPINEPVSRGDKISAAITSGPNGNWTISLHDATQSPAWTFTKVLPYSGPGASAEWIMEAPGVNGRQSSIANYGTTEFNPGFTTALTGQVSVNGAALGSPRLVPGDGGELVAGNPRRGYTVTSIPSSPDATTQSAFNISYGSTAPTAPTS